MARSSAPAAPYPFSLVLFCIFLILKLTNTIAWSWWWVTAPLWIMGAVFVAIIVVVILAGGIRQRRKGP